MLEFLNVQIPDLMEKKCAVYAHAPSKRGVVRPQDGACRNYVLANMVVSQAIAIK